jgi:hypothetical protein
METPRKWLNKYWCLHSILKKILTFSVKDRYQLNYFICIKDINAETITSLKLNLFSFFICGCHGQHHQRKTICLDVYISDIRQIVGYRTQVFIQCLLQKMLRFFKVDDRTLKPQGLAVIFSHRQIYVKREGRALFLLPKVKVEFRHLFSLQKRFSLCCSSSSVERPPSSDWLFCHFGVCVCKHYKICVRNIYSEAKHGTDSLLTEASLESFKTRCPNTGVL